MNYEIWFILYSQKAKHLANDVHNSKLTSDELCIYSSLVPRLSHPSVCHCQWGKAW